MTGAGDEELDRGLCASDADREQVIDTLKTAFAHGRLDRDEFDLRVGLALASRTRADLAAITADIPCEVAGPSLPSKRARPRKEVSVKAGAAIIAAPVLAGAMATVISSVAPVTKAPAAAGVFILFILALGIISTAIVATLIRVILLIAARARKAGR